MKDREFEHMWDRAKARDARQEEEWDSLTPEEKERRRSQFRDGFYERVSDDVTGDHDEPQTSST